MTRSLMLLALAACAPDPLSDGALPADQAPPPLQLVVSDVALGGKMLMQVEGANPNETIHILRSPTGPGAGSCLPQLGGDCLDIRDPFSYHNFIATDATGWGKREMNIPSVPSLDGTLMCFQAAAVRGSGGSQSVLSTVECSELGYDADADGYLDSRDLCPGEDDFFDWDQDDIPDGCDDPADRPQAYGTANPLVAWNRGMYQGRNVVWYIPPSATGLALIFHGTGGDQTVADAPETILILNELLTRGIGFVAFASDDRGSKTWTADVRPSQNGDFDRISAWRQSKITSGAITASTPIFGWGFSNGGQMVSYMSSAAPDSGWVWGAGAIQAHPGGNPWYNNPGDEPMLFISARWDASIAPADVQDGYDDHIARGNPGQYRMVPEQRLEPTRFDRSDLINRRNSLNMFKLVVNEGHFDKGGNRMFSAGAIEPVIELIGDHPDFYPSKPGKGVLSAVLATHAISGYYAEQIGDYFDAFN
jgi:predicted esterase